MKPEPVAKTTVCSVCGLSWPDHTALLPFAAPTLEVCVKLLKAELSKQRAYPFAQTSGVSIPFYGGNISTAS